MTKVERYNPGDGDSTPAYCKYRDGKLVGDSRGGVNGWCLGDTITPVEMIEADMQYELRKGNW